MKYWRRLRDAIWRKNIYGIEEGLRRIAILEKKTLKNPRPNGYLQRVLPFFIETKEMLYYLKCFLLLIFFLSIFNILFFLICDLKCIQLFTIILFFIVTILAVLYSICFKTPHEKDKTQKCGCLRRALKKAAYDKSIELKPKFHLAYSNKGLALYLTGNYEAAIDSYDKALKIKPDDASAYYNKGDALEELGRHKEAKQAFVKAAKLEKDS